MILNQSKRCFTKHQVNVDKDTPLLWVLRDELAMKGTKFGCGMLLKVRGEILQILS